MTNVDLDSQINSVDVEGDYMPTNELFWSKQKFESRFESISEYEVKDVEGVQGVQGDQDKSAGIYSIQRIGNTFYLGNRANNVVVCQKTAESFTTRTLSGHSDSVLCLQVDDESIISASSDNTVKVWSRSSYECLDTLSGHTSSVLQLQFNSTRLVTCSKDKTVIVWKIVDGKFVEETTLQDHKAAVNVVVFDAHRICSAGGDRVIRVYDATSFASKGVLKGHTRGIACLSMLPGGDTIVSGSSDNNLRIWSLSQMKCRHVLTGHSDLVRCVDYNSEVIVSGSYDTTIRLWSTATGEELAQLDGHKNRVFRVQLDSRAVTSCSQDNTIKVWTWSSFELSFLSASQSWLGRLDEMTLHEEESKTFIHSLASTSGSSDAALTTPKDINKMYLRLKRAPKSFLDWQDETMKETGLHVAARTNKIEFTLLLLLAGANPVLKDTNGNTAQEVLLEPGGRLAGLMQQYSQASSGDHPDQIANWLATTHYCVRAAATKALGSEDSAERQDKLALFAGCFSNPYTPVREAALASLTELGDTEITKVTSARTCKVFEIRMGTPAAEAAQTTKEDILYFQRMAPEDRQHLLPSFSMLASHGDFTVRNMFAQSLDVINGAEMMAVTGHLDIDSLLASYFNKEDGIGLETIFRLPAKHQAVMLSMATIKLDTILLQPHPERVLQLLSELQDTGRSALLDELDLERLLVEGAFTAAEEPVSPSSILHGGGASNGVGVPIGISLFQTLNEAELTRLMPCVAKLALHAADATSMMVEAAWDAMRQADGALLSAFFLSLQHVSLDLAKMLFRKPKPTDEQLAILKADVTDHLWAKIEEQRKLTIQAAVDATALDLTQHIKDHLSRVLDTPFNEAAQTFPPDTDLTIPDWYRSGVVQPALDLLDAELATQVASITEEKAASYQDTINATLVDDLQVYDSVYQKAANADHSQLEALCANAKRRYAEVKAAYPARPGPSHVAGPTSVISMMNLALQERQSFMDVIEDIEEKTEMIVELTTMKNSFRVAQKGFIRKKTVAAETDVSSVADMNRAICMAAENLQMGQTLDHVFSRTDITIVDFKDRVNNRTDAGWSDFVLTRLPMELQVSLRPMVTARKELGAHKAFAESRNKKEIMTVAGFMFDDSTLNQSRVLSPTSPGGAASSRIQVTQLQDQVEDLTIRLAAQSTELERLRRGSAQAIQAPDEDAYAGFHSESDVRITKKATGDHRSHNDGIHDGFGFDSDDEFEI